MVGGKVEADLVGQLILKTMIIREDTKRGMGTSIVRKDDFAITARRIKSFNTKTKMAVVYATIELKDDLTGKSETRVILKNDKPMTFKCKLDGFIAFDTKTRKEIK